jgi:hypothetical protein
MKQDDKELKKALEAIYRVQPSEAFVYDTQQRLPSRGTKLLWLILGYVVIWGTVAILAYLYYFDILQAIKNLLEMMHSNKMPNSNTFMPLFLCAFVLYTAIVHCVELMEYFYRQLFEKRQGSINKV